MVYDFQHQEKNMTKKNLKHLRDGFSWFHGTKKLLLMVSHELWARNQKTVFNGNLNSRAWNILLY